MPVQEASKPAAAVPNFSMTTFSTAINVTPSPDTPNTYIADIKRDWAIGVVPHGGYLLSLLTQAATTHLTTTRPKQNQPDVITAHVEFLSRSSNGRGEILITELKIGRQFSNLRAQLFQPDPKSPDKKALTIEALFTLGNLTLESRNGGLALETRCLPGLEAGVPARDGFELRWVDPRWPEVRPAALKLEAYYRKGSGQWGIGKEGKSVRELWIRWGLGVEGRGRGFDVNSLGYICDGFVPLPDNYDLENKWYPTLNYGLDVKRSAPPGGWEWLFMRVEMYESRNGRLGLDVVVCEEGGAVVCTSRHVALIVGAEMNYKGREAKI